MGPRRIDSAFAAVSEGLGCRRLLNAAPVGVEDVYELGAGHALVVGIVSPDGEPAFDETRWTDPIGPFLAVAPGAVVTEEFPVGVGYLPTGYGEVSVGGRGARWVLHDWLEVGDTGRGTVVVEDGGAVDARHWVEIADANGYGTVVVGGSGSRWNSRNWISVGNYRSRGVLRVEDGATLQTNNWMGIAENDGADGRVVLSGAGSRLVLQEWMNVGYSGGGTGVLYVGNDTIVTSTRIHAWNGSRVQGGGLIFSDVHTSGLTVGHDELLTIAGLLNLGGTARFDIGGTGRGTSYGAVDVGAPVKATLQRTVVNFVGNFAPKAGDRFTLINQLRGGSVSPGEGEVRGLAPGFRYSLDVTRDAWVLTALNDGVAVEAPPLGRGVLSNDGDFDRDAVTPVLVRRPAHGDLVLKRDGSFSYVPGPTFAGTDGFEYRADDGVFTSAPTRVTIRNPAPAAAPDAYAVNEDETLTVAAPGVLANDSGNASPVTAAVADGPDHGALSLEPDGSFVYAPDRNFYGTDTFTYRASDGMLESDAITVTLTVRPLNDAPVAVDDRAAVRKNRTLTLPTSDLLANDTDPDGDPLRVIAVAATADTRGRVSLENGAVTYQPDRGYAGPARFTYTVSDGTGRTATATVRVDVLRPQQGVPGRVTGRGSLDDRRKQFRLGVSATGGGDGISIAGTLLYTDPGRLDLRATDFDLFDVSRDGRRATIAGAATVNGREGYRFQAWVEDWSRSGSNDRFQIRVTGPGGFVDDSGRGRGGRIDRGGNIVVGGSEPGN